MALMYYHNPRCSKSRQGLEILKDNKIEPEIILYLETPLKPTEMESVLKKFLKSAQKSSIEALLRKKEDDFKEIKKLPSYEDTSAWAKLICKHPKILERPLLVGDQAVVIGRPPEDLLNSPDL